MPPSAVHPVMPVLSAQHLTDLQVAAGWRDAKADRVRFIDRVSELGDRASWSYDALRSAAEDKEEIYTLLRCLGVAAFAAINIMVLSAVVWSAAGIMPGQRDFLHWLSALIALPAVAYAGRPFFGSAVRAVAARRLNMDVPLSVGVILALGMSVLETLRHAPHAYFDSALMLLTCLLVARTLEQLVLRRTRAFAANVAALRAATVTKFVSDTELAEVPLASVRSGDLILVRSGERIAVDGVVMEGRSEIDQSLVTGETLPVSVAKDSIVYAGTLNVSGALRVRASTTPAPYPSPILPSRPPPLAGEGWGGGTGEARQGELDGATPMRDRAVKARARYVRIAHRAARLFSPLAHAAAFATLVAWVAFGASWDDAVISAIAVLIIMCPCALGLAVPGVQLVASGALFRAHVLPNSRQGIERLAGVDTILFDKTGTLTLPEPEVINAADIPPERLALAGRLALASRHPLAAAVARAACATEPLAAVEEPGQGVRGEFEGVALRLGRPSFCDAERRAAAILEADPAASVIAFVYGTERYVLAVRQSLRGDAIEVIAKLKQQGFAIEILSGDRTPAVAHAARTLGIDRWQAATTAADKIGHISALQLQGRSVLMVGDGVNDAPSLAAADASLSVATAAPLAQAAADAVFLGDRLEPVAAAIAIARRAQRLMRQNLLLALAYHVVALPLAVLGFASPLAAALAMSGASILVTINALRARPRERR
jgi:P-type Cu2+ transporter